MSSKLSKKQLKFKKHIQKYLNKAGGDHEYWRSKLESKYYADGLLHKGTDYCKAIFIAVKGYEYWELRKGVSLARVNLSI